MVLTTTVGEASGSLLAPLRATAKTASTISLSYGAPCSVDNHRIHFGPLAQLPSYFVPYEPGREGTVRWTGNSR